MEKEYEKLIDEMMKKKTKMSGRNFIKLIFLSGWDTGRREIKKAIDEETFQMNDMFKIIKSKKKNTEHDRGWRNCSIYLKELQKKFKDKTPKQKERQR